MNQDQYQFHYHAVNDPNGYLRAAPGSLTWNSGGFANNSNTYTMYTAPLKASAAHMHPITAPLPLTPTVVTEPEEEKPPRWSFKGF